MNLREYLCQLLGCGDCSEVEEQLVQCHEANAVLDDALTNAQETIRQLELIVPHPTPPKIDLVAQRDSLWVQSVIDSMKLNIQRLPLDQTYYLTNQSNFLNIVAWDWVDGYEYRKEKFDCENFAFLFKAHIDLYFNLNQVGLVISYRAGHAFNMVIYADGNVALLEPQNDVVWVYPQVPKPFYDLQDAIVVI